MQLAVGFAVFAVAVVVSYFSVVEEGEQNIQLQNGEQNIQLQDIFLVIDVSTSMSDESKLVFAKKAATEFVQTLELNRTSAHQIGLITFSNDAKLRLDLTDNPNQLIQVISTLAVEGSTEMADGILLATDHLQNGRSDAQKTIVLLSDGAADEGDDPLQASRFAQHMNIIIFSVGYGDDADVLTLSTIAHNTNGKYFDAKTGQDLAQTFNEIADILISPVSHYSSRALILLAIPVLLFIPAIEVGFTTMMGKFGDAPVKRNVAKQKNCPHCNHSNRAAAKFCLKCGKSINEPDDASVKRNVAKQKNCPHCNHSNRAAAKFCLKCGKSISGGDT